MLQAARKPKGILRAVRDSRYCVDDWREYWQKCAGCPSATRLPIQYEIRYREGFFRPTAHDLKSLAVRFNNRSIASICAVTETTIRKGLAAIGFQRKRTPRSPEGTISTD